MSTLMKLYLLGLNDREIAKRLKVGVYKVQVWREAKGLPTARQVMEIERRQLLKQGRTDRELAEIYGVTVSAIANWRVRRGLPAVPGGCIKKRKGREMSPSMQAFFRDLAYYYGKCEGEPDVLRFISAWRRERRGLEQDSS